MANWIITDEGSTIKVVHLGIEVFNSPKADTQIMAVPAKSGGNTTDVDMLYIGNDNSYLCQIPWSDVTVEGVAPSDLEDFEDKVNTVLNNVSGGGSTAPVDLTTDAAVALIDNTSDGTLYRITGTGPNPLPAGIENILIYGAFIGTDGYDYNNARAWVTGIGYIPCIYDVATNKINAQLTNKMFVSVDGLGGITIDSVVNNEWNGITFSATNTSGGLYTFTPSQTLQTIFTAVSMHTEHVIPQGADIIGFASTTDDYIHDEYYYTIYNTIFANDGSVAFPHNLITFIGYIKN